MANYAIFMGGTGSKCAEAMAFLCAGGAFSDSGPVQVLICDSDRANGNFTRACNILETYQQLQEKFCTFDKPRSRFLSARLAVSPWVVTWKNDAELKLDKLNDIQAGNGVDPQKLHARISESIRVMKALYKRSSMNQIISNLGYFGTPAVGASALRAALAEGSQDNNPFIQLKFNIENDLANGNDVRIILVGSVFGGTGAASLATIAYSLNSLLSENPLRRNQASLCALLMLPYFTYSKDSDLKVNGPRIDANKFPAACKRALEYYDKYARLRINGQDGIFDRIYMLGLPDPIKITEKANGSAKQLNEALFPEWEAALAIRHFFCDADVQKNNQKSYIKWVEQDTAEHKINVSWNHLSMPDLAGNIEALLLFSLVWHTHFKPQIDKYVENKERHVRDYFTILLKPYAQDTKGDWEMTMGQINQLTNGFMRWVSESITTENALAQQLIDNKKYKLSLNQGQIDIPADGWKNIVTGRPGKAKNAIVLRMGKEFDGLKNSPYQESIDNVSVFFHTLFQACDMS
jgi:hypothetical protein